MDGEVTAVEHHRRSPANRSYTQAQARNLFEEAGLAEIQLWRGFTQEAATAEDMLFTVVGVRRW
jgi:hypothetical protein